MTDENLACMASLVEAAISRIEAGKIDAVLAGMLFALRQAARREIEEREEQRHG